jgi:hypothetical protein
MTGPRPNATSPQETTAGDVDIAPRIVARLSYRGSRRESTFAPTASAPAKPDHSVSRVAPTRIKPVHAAVIQVSGSLIAKNIGSSFM